MEIAQSIQTRLQLQLKSPKKLSEEELQFFVGSTGTDPLRNIENIIGSDYDDTIFGGVV